MSETNNNILYTIGHSNHTINHFIGLLECHKINMVVDVRSAPYSRYSSQFNKKVISVALKEADIQYMFWGNELGARPDVTECYEGGRVDFKRIAERKEFKDALALLLEAIEKHHIALMCAEKEPLECHRTVLICRKLKENNLSIKHILEDGTIEDHHDTERRLVKMLKIEPTLFEPPKKESDLIEQAYDQQSKNISHRSQEPGKVYERAK